MAEWKLFWSDEFDGEVGTPISDARWMREVGSSGADHHELQYYTDRPENAFIDGKGNLAIVACEGNPAKYECHYGACRYTSARLTTRERMLFTHGRVGERIKMPYGQGIWPAFWMVGSRHDMGDWPVSGEIDIMEHIGKEPRTIHGGVHGPGYYGSGGLGKIYHSERPFADDFHVFGIDWEVDAIHWTVDGNRYHMLTAENLRGKPWAFNHSFYINLNVAVGGNWAGNPDKSSVFPQTMLVDYVRVYQADSG
ncbi:MAG: glycoside hydrolase family 16 protein [Chloroflexota bacterium]